MSSPRGGRPTARYGNNPFRLQHYYQFQVCIKPSPDDFQELYLGSLRSLGFDLLTHDIRFVEDNWESPTLGAWGLGWEVWLNGMEVSQFTYFQQVGGLDCRPVMGEITYGLERLGMYIQGKESIFDIVWSDGPFGAVTYGDVFHQNEVEQSAYNFEMADTAVLSVQFDAHEAACRHLLEHKLVLPAYEQMVKASHTFNLLDARPRSLRHRAATVHSARAHSGARRGRGLSRQPGSAGLPLDQEPADFDRLMSAHDLLFELFTEELPPRALQSLSDALTQGVLKGIDAAGIPHGRVRTFATPRRLALRIEKLAEHQPDRQVERRGPPLAASFDAKGTPTQAAARIRQELRSDGGRAVGTQDGQGRVAAVSRHGTRRGRGQLAARHHQPVDRGVAHPQTHAMGRARRRVRETGARRGSFCTARMSFPSTYWVFHPAG